MKRDKALVVVDVQNDFCPGGALAVPDGDAVIPVLNKYIAEFRRQGLAVFFSRDWHPEVTRHFKSRGGAWPAHCIQDTHGAAFHSGLQLPKGARVLSKGTDPDKEGYSVFSAHDDQGVAFETLLATMGIRQLFIGGLATDYCVKETALEALDKGFQVVLLVDAMRGVNLQPGDADRAVQEIVARGATKMEHRNLAPLFRFRGTE